VLLSVLLHDNMNNEANTNRIWYELMLKGNNALMRFFII
jgi:hypothetical protein